MGELQTCRRCGEADAREQVLETGFVAQVVHDGIYVEVDEPVGVVLEGFFQVIEGAVVFPQADVDSGEEMGRDVFAFGEAGEVVEDLLSFLFSSSFAVGMRESCAHQRAAA